MEQIDTNIISLSSFRRAKESCSKEQLVQNYLKLLTFNELMNESQLIISELKESPLNEDLMFRSKLILKEFNKRLTGQSPELANSLGTILKNVDQKINEILE